MKIGEVFHVREDRIEEAATDDIVAAWMKLEKTKADAQLAFSFSTVSQIRALVYSTLPTQGLDFLS